jgi:hypothetical protein
VPNTRPLSKQAEAERPLEAVRLVQVAPVRKRRRQGQLPEVAVKVQVAPARAAETRGIVQLALLVETKERFGLAKDFFPSSNQQNAFFWITTLADSTGC